MATTEAPGINLGPAEPAENGQQTDLEAEERALTRKRKWDAIPQQSLLGPPADATVQAATDVINVAAAAQAFTSAASTLGLAASAPTPAPAPAVPISLSQEAIEKARQVAAQMAASMAQVRLSTVWPGQTRTCLRGLITPCSVLCTAVANASQEASSQTGASAEEQPGVAGQPAASSVPGSD